MWTPDRPAFAQNTAINGWRVSGDGLLHSKWPTLFPPPSHRTLLACSSWFPPRLLATSLLCRSSCCQRPTFASLLQPGHKVQELKIQRKGISICRVAEFKDSLQGFAGTSTSCRPHSAPLSAMPPPAERSPPSSPAPAHLKITCSSPKHARNERSEGGRGRLAGHLCATITKGECALNCLSRRWAMGKISVSVVLLNHS